MFTRFVEKKGHIILCTCSSFTFNYFRSLFSFFFTIVYTENNQMLYSFFYTEQIVTVTYVLVSLLSTQYGFHLCHFFGIPYTDQCSIIFLPSLSLVYHCTVIIVIPQQHSNSIYSTLMPFDRKFVKCVFNSLKLLYVINIFCP